MTRDGAITRPRLGTKATQGINQDIAVHARASSAAAANLIGGPMRPCPYPHHRTSDWRLDAPDAPIVCGVCHPPADGLTIVTRKEIAHA